MIELEVSGITAERYLGTFFPDSLQAFANESSDGIDWQLSRRVFPRISYRTGLSQQQIEVSYRTIHFSGRFINQDRLATGLSGTFVRPANPSEIFGLIHAARRDVFQVNPALVESLRQDAAIELNEMFYFLGFSAINIDS